MKQLRLIGLSTVVACLQVAFAAPTVSDVKVTPIAPWGMAIDYTVSGAMKDDVDAPVVVSATGSSGTTYLSRNIAGATSCSNGAHRVYWNMAKDGITEDVQNGQVSVAYWLTYCVIDLSGGTEAAFYPVTYLESEPEGGFAALDEYKTTKLVLKRVEAGSFIMGEDQTNESHRVTLTKPFYMGLFEVTQKQWELVTGSNPSYCSGDTRPVEQVSYDMIRGASQGSMWPSSNAVDEDSFLGRLRARTNLNFDLPTEAQWEYTCRAGTTTSYSFGYTYLRDYYMWCSDSSVSRGAPKEVGTRKPNPWGFYDMHGNVWEWCLDWWSSVLSYGTDPNGPSSDTHRTIRGGSYYDTYGSCTSYQRAIYINHHNPPPVKAFGLLGLCPTNAGLHSGRGG